jgi:mannosyltransferase OCH1-like enzyme
VKKYGNIVANNDPDWQLFEKLFEDNYLNYTGSKEEVLPKRIHQIWLGGTLPDKFKPLTETWQKFHPAWEYKLWTDKDVQGLNIKKKRQYAYAKNYGMKADILRYEILAKQGGVYVDIDFECLKPFDPFLYLKFFGGTTYTAVPCLYNSLIATTAHHPIIEKVRADINFLYDGHKSSVIMDKTGPYHFTRSFLSSIRGNSDKVVSFPVDYFYPWKHNNRKDENPKSYITDFSFAIHYWAISWIKGYKNESKLF